MFRGIGRLMPLLLWAVCARAEPPAVVATIAPLHSLTAAVGRGRVEPMLLLPAGVSPHTYQLRPSEARRLSDAALLVRIGPGFESFLDAAPRRLAPQARVLSALELPLPVRLSYDDGQAPQDARDLAHETHDHAHAQAHGHGHGGRVDPHLWLHPSNAVTIGHAIAAALAALDPQHGPLYRANADALAGELARLQAALEARLAPVRERGFATAHDAFRYFAHAFGLRLEGAFALDPEVPVGAATRGALRAKALAGAIACLAVEPQFAPAAVDALARESGLPVAVLDPLGSGIAPGPDLYALMMRQNAEALADCLARGRGSG